MRAIIRYAVRRFLPAGLGAALLVPLTTAQEPQPPEKAVGNAFTRMVYGNFQAPSVRGVDTGADGGLDAMVRDGILRLTEDDAVRLALENNIDINVERFGPYFSLWGIEKSRAALEPTLGFTANVNRNVTPSSSLLQGATLAFSLATTYNVDYTKPFEQGLDLSVQFNTQRVRVNSVFTAFNPSHTSVFNISATQHLLKDFGSAVRGRFLRIARNNYSMSEEEFAARVTDVLTTVLLTYWELVYADEDIKVKEASRKLAEVILEQNKLQAQVGTMSDLDVVQAEAEVATRTEQLVVARSNRRLAEDQLKKLISSRPDPGLAAATIEPASRPDSPPSVTRPLAEAIASALEKRPEMKRQLLDLENKKINLRYTSNQLRPILDFTGGFTMNGLGGDLLIRDASGGIFDAPVVGIRPGGFWDSIDSLSTRKYLGYVLGMTFRLPIGNSDARASNAQAQIDLKQGDERLRSLKQQIALDVRQAYENVDTSRARLDTAEVTVRYSQRKLQGEQDKYGMGATTTRFVLEAQRDLQDAQTRFLRAKIDLIKNRVNLDKAVGETLPAHNIEVKKALGELR